MTARLLILSVFYFLIVASAVAEWPGVEFSEVRAYAYNRHDDDFDIISNGHLSRTVVDKRGVTLTTEQTKTLIASTTGKHPVPLEGAACFNPHHAFVFYDAAHKPVAWVEVCFECVGAETNPPQKGWHYDLAALQKLATELKLPLLHR